VALAGLSTPRSRSDPSRPDLTEVVVVRAIDAATGSGSNSPSPKLYHAPCSYDDPAHRSPQGRGAPPLRRDPSLPAPPRRSLLGLGFGVGGPRRRQSFGLQIDGGFPNRARYGTSGRAPRIGPGDHATEHQSHRRPAPRGRRARCRGERRAVRARAPSFPSLSRPGRFVVMAHVTGAVPAALPPADHARATCGLPPPSPSAVSIAVHRWALGLLFGSAFSHSPSRTWPGRGRSSALLGRSPLSVWLECRDQPGRVQPVFSLFG